MLKAATPSLQEKCVWVLVRSRTIERILLAQGDCDRIFQPFPFSEFFSTLYYHYFSLRVLFFFTCVVLRIVLYLQSYRWQERNDKKENYYSIIIVTLVVRGDILLRNKYTQ